MTFPLVNYATMLLVSLLVLGCKTDGDSLLGANPDSQTYPTVGGCNYKRFTQTHSEYDENWGPFTPSDIVQNISKGFFNHEISFTLRDFEDGSFPQINNLIFEREGDSLYLNAQCEVKDASNTRVDWDKEKTHQFECELVSSDASSFDKFQMNSITFEHEHFSITFESTYVHPDCDARDSDYTVYFGKHYVPSLNGNPF